MAAAPAHDVDGLVLAGGRGARFGGLDKGWVEHAGQPLIRHAIARLQPQVQAVLVSANRNLERYRTLGVVTVADDTTHGDYPGPLAGVLAGLRASRATWIAVMPCDAPEAPADLVAQLRAATMQASAAVVSVQGRVEPLFCLLRRDLAPSLTVFLDEGGRKAAAWLAHVGAVEVPFADAGAFANINSPADLPARR